MYDCVVARSCDHPGEIANGVRNGSSFTYHQRVSYSCLHGHRLVGRPYRVCQANGKWSSKLPDCKRQSLPIFFCFFSGPPSILESVRG